MTGSQTQVELLAAARVEADKCTFPITSNWLQPVRLLAKVYEAPAGTGNEVKLPTKRTFLCGGITHETQQSNPIGTASGRPFSVQNDLPQRMGAAAEKVHMCSSVKFTHAVATSRFGSVGQRRDAREGALEATTTAMYLRI